MLRESISDGSDVEHFERGCMLGRDFRRYGKAILELPIMSRSPTSL